MQRKMEVNESNSKWAFPSILRPISNFLRQKSSLLRKVQRTWLPGLALRDCFSRCCVLPWRWLREFVNWGDNIDSLWKKKMSLHRKFNFNGTTWNEEEKGKREKEKKRGRKEKHQQQHRCQLSSIFRFGKASTIFFFPGTPYSTLLKCLLKKIWDELQANRAVAKLGLGRNNLYSGVRKIMDFFFSFFAGVGVGRLGGRKDLTSSIRKSRDGEGYRPALQIFCIW